MTDKAVHLLVPEGMADWEPGLAVAILRRWAGVPIRTVGFTREPVLSMGGVRILPDIALDELRPDQVRLFIVPGGDLWEGEYPAREMDRVLKELAGAGVPIAAICGGTIPVARAGLLSDRRYTSNGADYLAPFAPGLVAPANYVEALAARDRGVITASGLGPVDFAHEIFAELGVFSDADLAGFLAMYRHREMPPPEPGQRTE